MSVGHSSPSAFQKPSAPSATASSGATAKPRFCKSSSSSRQSWALSRAPSVKPSSSFLPSGVAPMITRMHCLVVFKTGLQVNAVGPHVDVALGRQIALPPMLVLVEPDLLQPRDGRGRQARRILAEQGSKRLLEIAGRDALQVKDRDQHLQAAGAPRVGRQDRGREADAPGIIGSATVAHARLAHADRADAGHHLAFRQVPVTNHAAQASSGLQIDMLGEEFRHLGLDRLGQQGARSVAQHLGERVGERPWLKQLDDVSIGHGVSLLCWRSGGSNTPTIRRLLPVRPSPTSAHSSAYVKVT